MRIPLSLICCDFPSSISKCILISPVMCSFDPWAMRVDIFSIFNNLGDDTVKYLQLIYRLALLYFQITFFVISIFRNLFGG